MEALVFILLIVAIPLVIWRYVVMRKRLYLERERAEADALFHRHSDLVDRFFDVAHRKVAVLDEYGDKNWDALTAELKRIVSKLADREGAPRQQVLEMLRSDERRVDKALAANPELLRWRMLAMLLDRRFRERHASMRIPATETDRLSGVAFEAYLEELLREHGFERVRGTPASGDQGADVLAEKHGRTVVIQTKRYEGSVGNKAVQEVIAALAYYKGDEGWVVTNSVFTPAARALAQASGIRLIDGVALTRLGEFLDEWPHRSAEATRDGDSAHT